MWVNHGKYGLCWDGKYHIWEKTTEYGKLQCRGCGRVHKCVTTFIEKCDNDNPDDSCWGYFRTRFLDTERKCPGVSTLAEAITSILNDKVFFVHLGYYNERIGCWQDRIAGHPSRVSDLFDYYPGRGQTVYNPLNLEMNQSGGFIAETAEEFITTIADPDRDERILRFAK